MNADDFGASKEINEAVVEAFRDGILTSCSLMVTGEAFTHAVMLARRNKLPAVGLHLVVVSGRSVLPRSQIPGLVDDLNRFSEYPVSAGLTYYFSRPARRQLKKEIRAQFERFAATGLKLSHIDGHKHMHMHPVVLDIALELGERFGVRRIRVPRDDLHLAWGFRRGNPLTILTSAAVFALVAPRARRIAARKGFTGPAAVYGNLLSGHLTEQYALAVLKRLRSRTNEFYFHPAKPGRGAVLDKNERQCLREFEILVGRKAADCIEARRIRLTNYPQLS